MSAAALLQLLETTSYSTMFVADWKSIFYEGIQILAYLLKYLLAFESFHQVVRQHLAQISLTQM